VAYFKPLGSSTSNKAMARFHGLIWVLIDGQTHRCRKFPYLSFTPQTKKPGDNP
jgi:hypothetical protein